MMINLMNRKSGNSSDMGSVSNNTSLTEAEGIVRNVPERFLNVNVGGTSYKLRYSSLLIQPSSRLGQLCMAPTAEAALQLTDGFLTETKEHYFERSPVLFDHLILSYRSSELHIPENMCPTAFLAELDYWRLSHSLIKGCCADYVHALPHGQSIQTVPIAPPPSSSPSTSHFGPDHAESNHVATLDVMDDVDAEVDGQKSENSDQAPGRCPLTRRAMWQFLEVPSSSIPAMGFMGISVVFILATVVVLLMGSLKQFQYRDPVLNTTDAIMELEVVDAVCVVWFSLEYVFRLWAAPERLLYVKSALSVIDLLACAPFYIEQFFNIFGVHNQAFANFRRSLVPIRVLRVMRVLRVLRVLKVARYSKGFQSMGQTLLRSWRELVLLTLFMMTTNIMFSTAMYFLEADVDGTKFHSIPEAAWWCVITMTTVGYGDVYPVSAMGKLLAGLVSISGIILLAFPISVIVENFNQEYGDVYPVSAMGKLLAGLVSISGIILLAFPISVIVENFNQEYHPRDAEEDNEDKTGLPQGAVGNMKMIDGKIYVEVTTPKPKKRKAHVKAF